jgi:hypothetical protein
MKNQIKAKTAIQIETEAYISAETRAAIVAFDRHYLLKTSRVGAVHADLMSALSSYAEYYGKPHSCYEKYKSVDLDN